MPPKDLVIDETTDTWMINPVTGEREELHILDDVEITPESIPRGGYTPKKPWVDQNAQFRIPLTNNDRKMHSKPMRRGLTNKDFKKYWKSLISGTFL